MSSTRNTVVLIGIFLLVMIGWDWMMKQIWPVKTIPPKPTQETVALAAGSMVTSWDPGKGLKRVVKLETLNADAPEPKKDPESDPKPPEVKAADDTRIRGKLIPLGRGDSPFYLQVLFNTVGGSVQQIVLTEFHESDREGLEVVENGKPKSLHLVPGYKRVRTESIRAERKIPYPVLLPGEYDSKKAKEMSDPSFMLFHYDKAGDERPVLTLGERNWDLIENESNLDPAADEQSVVFRTKLGEPHNVQITKTFTLKRKEYHIGLKVDIKRLDGLKGPNQFRYQMVGPNGLPIEGEWYTTIFRQAIVGFGDERGNTSRYIEDGTAIRATEGSDRQNRTEKLAIRYAAVAVQFFASAIAVDDEQENRKFLEFVRATPVGPTVKGKEFLDDLTVRAITEAFNPDTDVSHKYMLYHGPVKVRLLRQMPKGTTVDDALVLRYLDKLKLDTLTDAPLPNALGRFANAIFWTDIVIFFTNVVHSLLYILNMGVPSLGLCILLITLIVRGILFPLSRRQAANAAVMQAKMAKLQPELRKLQEKCGDDFQKLNQERLLLYRQHGVNPFSAMGGCLLVFLQMPIFMGLYYALQESVFFRLDPFLWMPNLAAPDMLIFWTESIPFISTPNDLGSTLYLGPYFNILPVLAVVLMLYQQKAMMPPSDDPQVQAQQRMMKFMMIAFGLFFYKVAAGLCLYFIASSLWGLAERKFIPKHTKPDENDPDSKNPDENGPSGSTAQARRQAAEEEAAKPLGWWGRKKQGWKERWKELLEQAQKQQEFRREQTDKPGGDTDRGNKKKKKKRK